MSVTALTHHGGGVDQAARAWPDAPLPWIDLSTGINPVPWARAAALAIDLTRLPTATEVAALETAAAEYFGVPAGEVMAVPGSELALRALGRIGLPAPHRHIAPGYRTHGEAFASSVAINAATVAADAGTLLLANPANPTGLLHSTDAIRRLAGPGWLIVDEAFADCHPGASIADDRPERTIILRSFGKFFGLAGVRLGFVLADEDILARLRGALGAWPVSATAIAYGAAAYRDRAWIAGMRAELVERAAALDALLARHGLSAQGDCPLFRLIETDRLLFEPLARAGILTRPFADHPRWLRIGLPHDEAAAARLDRALADG